ncbi:FxSxx-COOH system tetratricopeptide repeat protein [Phytohabitans houttuyneae]|uniref:Tetratricopeptide repeat protein n=1 Tax=Phytohabitans houttuyneae TaxID=1076126 RepID=A0A6V8K129_9ACTN|nr:tetratricopeptide repeat protein [Phytohabitans houttuyneae]
MQVGDGTVQHNYFAGRVPVSWPHRVGVVPALADGYQGRQALAELDRPPCGGTAVLTQVLSGFGGVGKTQLAAAYAHHVWTRRAVDLLVWITATSREAVVAGYAQAAADVLAVEDGDAERAAVRFLAWLAATDRRWLIVLDDLQAPADLTGLWPPTTGSGTVVVTTRRRDAALAGAGRRLIDVGLFTPGEAVGYLRHKLPHEPLDQLAHLTADLGHLPLALAQATAYMLDRALDCAGYRRRLTDRRRSLAHLFPEPDALPDQHRATVDATWSLSVDAADRLHPAGVARLVLDLVALLDPNGVPSGLFATAAVLDYLRASRAVEVAEPVDVETAADAVHNLHRLSLATVDPAAGRLRVHSLVQRATRDRFTPDRRHTAAHAAADALMQIWPDPERDPTDSQALRANAAALHQHSGDALLLPTVHAVLFRTGQSLGDTGQVSGAVAHFTQLVTDCLRVLSSDHPDTLAARSHLAWWQREAGDPTGAAQAAEQLLADRLRILGPDHPDTLTTRNTIAYCRGEAGDPAGAATAFAELLADRLRVLGPEHPDTFHTRANLAWWRGEAGDLVGAAQAAQQLLADRLRVLGPDHPDTLATRGNLARWQGLAGDPAGAVTAVQQLLTDRSRILGPDHPATLDTRSQLARWRGQDGDPAGAIEALEQVLADRLRILGPDHPDTLDTRRQLARWIAEAGDPAGAVAALTDLLGTGLRVFGPDHPDTLATRSQLAFWRGAAGDFTAAAAAAEEVLAHQLRLLGPNHPDTLSTRHQLSHWRGRAGNPADAATALVDLLADCLRVLGPDHLDTLVIRHDYAYWLGQAGQAAAAAAAFEELLPNQQRVLGSDHPYTVATQHALVYWQERSTETGTER